MNWIQNVEEALRKRGCISLGMKRDGNKLTVSFDLLSLRTYPKTLEHAEESFEQSVDAMVRSIQKMDVGSYNVTKG